MLAGHRSRSNAIGNHLEIIAAPSLQQGAEPAPTEALLSAWRMPCILLDVIDGIFSELLGVPDDAAREAYVLTLDAMPSLTAKWLQRSLASTGHAVGQAIGVPAGPDGHASQVRRFEYRVAIGSVSPDVAGLAVIWFVTLFNGIVNAYLDRRPLDDCHEALRPVSDGSLRRLRDAA